MKIGYIGLGALGSELARRFLPAHDLCVWDLNTGAVQEFARHGARAARSPVDLARHSEVVLLCLPRTSDVRQVLFGSGALASALAPGTLVIDQTSGVASETRALAGELASLGIDLIDAAVSASPHIVAQGGATLMAAGPAALYERALPVLRCITPTVHRCGARVGDGQAMKTVNNAMNGGCRLGTLEMVALGRKAGLSLEDLTEVLNRGEGRNQTTEKMLPAIAQGRASTNFALSLMLKDVNQAVTLGLEAGVPMPITSATRSLLQVGANQLGPAAQLEDMVGLIESMADVRLRRQEGEVVGLGASDGMAPGAAARLQLVDRCVGAMAAAITYECVAAGVKHGLDLEAMATLLHTSSGWSAASQRLLPALSAGTTTSPLSIGDVVQALQAAAGLGIECGAPTLLVNAARALYEWGANTRGARAGLDQMARVVEAGAGVDFARGRPAGHG